MKSPPMLNHHATAPVEDSDAAAEAQAARARQAGSDIVRDHLQHHIVNNPGQSSDYVCWVATLHPENADVTVDQRFFIPGNPWWRIYEETKNNPNNQSLSIPTATAVPVVNSDEEQPMATSGSTNSSDNKDDVPNANVTLPPPNPPFLMVCNPMDMCFGFMMTVLAAMAVFLCEFFALMLCYLPAVMFYRLAKCLEPPNVCTGFLHSLFVLIYWILALCDSILLLTSVLCAEICAFAGGLVTLFTGGILMSMHWHQYIRRLCHGIRILFRKCNSVPPRKFRLFGFDDDSFPTTSDSTNQGNASNANSQNPIPDNTDTPTATATIAPIDLLSDDPPLTAPASAMVKGHVEHVSKTTDNGSKNNDNKNDKLDSVSTKV